MTACLEEYIYIYIEYHIYIFQSTMFCYLNFRECIWSFKTFWRGKVDNELGWNLTLKKPYFLPTWRRYNRTFHFLSTRFVGELKIFVVRMFFDEWMAICLYNIYVYGVLLGWFVKNRGEQWSWLQVFEIVRHGCLPTTVVQDTEKRKHRP